MIKRLKVGIILMLIGIGIPLVLLFFQKDGDLFKIATRKTDALKQIGLNVMRSTSNLLDGFKEFEFEVIPDQKKSTTFMEYVDRELLKKEIERLQKRIFAARHDAFLLEKEIYETSELNIHVPYKYSIGLGVLLFMIGIGIIITTIAGRKRRTS